MRIAGSRTFQIRFRRLRSNQERRESDEVIADEVRLETRNRDLVGLASRAAGFAVRRSTSGTLQGLASFRLLGAFDYLSTVWGGGYIGAGPRGP